MTSTVVVIGDKTYSIAVLLFIVIVCCILAVGAVCIGCLYIRRKNTKDILHVADTYLTKLTENRITPEKILVTATKFECGEAETVSQLTPNKVPTIIFVNLGVDGHGVGNIITWLLQQSRK